MGLFRNLRRLMGDANRLAASTGAASGAVREASTQIETKRHLEQYGVTTTAVVQAARPTAMRLNESPVIEIDLLVRRREGNVPLTARDIVHRVRLAHVSAPRMA